jgi:hypothetical protein
MVPAPLMVPSLYIGKEVRLGWADTGDMDSFARAISHMEDLKQEGG